MSERKLKRQMLRKNLIKMDLGDEEAEKIVMALGRSMKDETERTGGKAKKVKVTFPSGETKIYDSRKDVSATFNISKNTLAKLISDGIAHSSGLEFENYSKGDETQ